MDRWPLALPICLFWLGGLGAVCSGHSAGLVGPTAESTPVATSFPGQTGKVAVAQPDVSSAQRPDRLAERGTAALAVGDLERAEALFREALGLDPVHVGSLIGLSQVLERSGSLRTALEGLESASMTLLNDARFSDAIVILDRLVELEPRPLEKSQELARLGRLLLLEQRFDEARGRLEEALPAQGQGEVVALDLASVLWELGELQAAEEQLLALAEAGSRAAQRQLGGFLLWQARFEEAQTWLRAAVQGRPLVILPVDLRIDLARALAGAVEVADSPGTEQIEQALEVFRSALAAAPEHSELQFGYATLLDRFARSHPAGDDQAAEQARSHFAIARRLMAEDQISNRQLALLDAQMARARTALSNAAPEIALSELEGISGVVEAHRLRAQAYLALGELEQSLREATRALGLEPGRADLRALLAEIRSRRQEE